MGSVVRKLKKPFKKIKKLVPKEAAGIMQMAAPFMGPVAGPIAYGLGSLKQRGKINPLMMAAVMAPHMRWGGEGMSQFRPTGYGRWGGDAGLTSRELLFGQGQGEGLLRGPGEWMEEKLWGRAPLEGVESMHPVTGEISMTPGIEGTRGWLGSEGVAGTLTKEGRGALAESKLAGALLGKEGDLAGEGVSILKAVSWGSSIVGGIQAGKFKDAQEAADAAAAAAEADGITDSEWIEAARAEAAAYWDKWRAETTFAQGGRVGYNMGQLVRPAPGRPGYKGDDDLPLEISIEERMERIKEIMKKMEDIKSGKTTDPKYDEESRIRGIEGIEGQMAGGGDRGWRAQMLAEELADEQYGKEFYDLSDDEQTKIYQIALDMIDTQGMAQGGRVGYRLGMGPVGGIQGIQPMRPQLPMTPQAASMNVPPPREGGLGRLPIEADMRYTGGFMPYGEEEKADDVPARLSKNEFVFTADAVRAAGGGSVNQGAKKLYDTMKQLEAQV